MAVGPIRSILTPVFIALAAGRCGVGGTAGPGSSDPVPDPSATTRILFVGNSLTYVNDLPGMVKALADSAGIAGVQTAQVAKPDYALEDHLADGQAPGVINRGGWHIVVMQQGPSSQPDSRVNLRYFAGVFAQLIRSKDGLPALYMVWPSVARPQDFEGSSESYRLAAEDVDGLLLAAGDAWQAAWRRDPAMPLYGPDGFHPSLQGTYLAALTAFGALFHRSVVGSPDGLWTPAGVFQLSRAQARLLQESADEVNAALIH
jgi:hypothetical protein